MYSETSDPTTNCCNRCRRLSKGFEVREAFLVTVFGVPALLCGPCIGAWQQHAWKTASIGADAFLKWIIHPE